MRSTALCKERQYCFCRSCIERIRAWQRRAWAPAMARMCSCVQCLWMLANAQSTKSEGGNQAKYLALARKRHAECSCNASEEPATQVYQHRNVMTTEKNKDEQRPAEVEGRRISAAAHLSCNMLLRQVSHVLREELFQRAKHMHNAGNTAQT